MATVREKIQACIDDAIELNTSGLRYITKEQINEAIGQEIFIAVHKGEITNEEGDELYLEYAV